MIPGKAVVSSYQLTYNGVYCCQLRAADHTAPVPGTKLVHTINNSIYFARKISIHVPKACQVRRRHLMYVRARASRNTNKIVSSSSSALGLRGTRVRNIYQVYPAMSYLSVAAAAVDECRYLQSAATRFFCFQAVLLLF